jgi:hypothetical protein
LRVAEARFGHSRHDQLQADERINERPWMQLTVVVPSATLLVAVERGCGAIAFGRLRLLGAISVAASTVDGFPRDEMHEGRERGEY